jgi:hypothetical protein
MPAASVNEAPGPGCCTQRRSLAQSNFGAAKRRASNVFALAE